MLQVQDVEHIQRQATILEPAAYSGRLTKYEPGCGALERCLKTSPGDDHGGTWVDHSTAALRPDHHGPRAKQTKLRSSKLRCLGGLFQVGSIGFHDQPRLPQTMFFNGDEQRGAVTGEQHSLLGDRFDPGLLHQWEFRRAARHETSKHLEDMARIERARSCGKEIAMLTAAVGSQL